MAGEVIALGEGWPGTRELTVRADDGQEVKSLAYLDLVGDPAVGDRVLLNANALVKDLGTGGYAMVVALPDRLPEVHSTTGHLIKARYTPLQTMVLGADEQDSSYHDALREADNLAGMPVIAADLHSALPAILAGIRQDRPEARIVYVMTDGGALPARFSRTVAGLREAGWLSGVVTTGQSFGGDLEAVTVHTGLLAARWVLNADAAVVTQGPGNLGTGTKWGFSGVAAGEALNACGVLGGRGVAALRVSQSDERRRHRGISHHSRTAYGRVLLTVADLVVPMLRGADGVPEELADQVQAEAAEMLREAPHLTGHVVSTSGLGEALAASPVAMSTMGRSPAQDPAAFLASAAAGRHAADLMVPLS